MTRQFNPFTDYQLLFRSAPNLFLVLSPSLIIAEASDNYCRATRTKREEILGRNVFDVFPEDPNDPTASGEKNSRASFERVVKLRHPDAMAVQKHDVRRPESEGGGFEVRYWSPLNTPVLDENGEVAWIIHRVEDVTEYIKLQAQDAASNKLHQEQLSTIEQLREANRSLAQRDNENARLQQSLEMEISERRKTEEMLKQ
jgi:PAS domain-containing protein